MPYTIRYLVLCLLLTGVPCRAAEVLIIADAQLKPVMDVTQGIHKTLRASTKTYAPAEVRGGLAALVQREEARVVITLGHAALAEALALPPSIPVIYDLVVLPSATTRPNTTGFFMATPVGEYTSLIRNHLNSIKQIAVLGSRAQLDVLAMDAPQATAYSVSDSVEFVKTVNRLETANAILLLPDAAVLTATAMDEVYLFSFRKGIPLLGVSERNVREGALVALVVDMVHVGRMIGEAATKALNGMDVGKIRPSPPAEFDLFLNTATARKMGIQLPDEMIRMAKRVYP
jgi:ABC-type uncharacterized transport system substrate-binding protein